MPTLALSPPRRFVTDLMHFAARTPTVPARRVFDVARLADARSRADRRLGWAALMIAAYGRVCAARPELRRTYLGRPYERLYEHAEPVAAVTVEREYAGEAAVFVGLIRGPDRLTPIEIQDRLDRMKHAPVEEIGSFRRILRVSGWPRPIRRAAWSLAMNWVGSWKARYCGTFGVSSVAGFGAELPHLLSPLTTALSYGPQTDGRMAVTLTFDHRALDGATAARALAELERVLTASDLRTAA